MAAKDGRVGFGVVGLNWGLGRCAMIQAVPAARLVAVAARSEERARPAGEKFGVDWYTDYRDMLKRDDLDVVAVYTPSGWHQDVAVAAARAGKHVLTTKPLEITLERCDAVIAACRAAGVKLATEFMTRHVPLNYALQQAVQQGKLGKLFLGEFAYKCFRPQSYYESSGGYRGGWAVDGGGAIMLQAIHTVDQMLWLLGDVESVTAYWGTFTHRIEVEDTAVAAIKFRSGAVATLVGTTSFLNDKPPGQYGGGTVTRLEVVGEGGSAVLVDNALTMWKTAAGDPPPAAAAPPTINVFDDFARWVKDDGYSAPTLVKAAESRRTVEFVLALYESARSGRTVALPL